MKAEEDIAAKSAPFPFDEDCAARELERARAGAELFIGWLRAKALPLWATVGFDAGRECFHERLDWGGKPIHAAPRRAMVQARQIYVFSHAAQLGWFPEAGRLAEIAMNTLLRDFCEGSAAAGFSFSIDANGCVVSNLRDAYAHAFILFAIASLHRLNGDPRLIAAADETIGFVDGQLADPRAGGLFDGFPPADRCKRQNPHMHLLEAYLALETSAPGRGYIDRARKLVDLFKAHLFQPEAGVLLEYFAEDWSAHPDPAKCQIWEPGHHFEWVWLLREYEKLSGDDIGDCIGRLDETARAAGVSENRLIFDELASNMSVVKTSHRIWPHTEAAKAAVARRLQGDPRAAGFAANMVGVLMDVFLDRPFDGGWIDHVSAERRPLVDYVPASSLYHLFLAGAELARGFSPSPSSSLTNQAAAS